MKVNQPYIEVGFGGSSNSWFRHKDHRKTEREVKTQR